MVAFLSSGWISGQAHASHAGAQEVGQGPAGRGNVAGGAQDGALIHAHPPQLNLYQRNHLLGPGSHRKLCHSEFCSGDFLMDREQ